MELLDSLFISDTLHTVSQALLIPTVVLLIALIAYAVYSLGSLLIEALLEHKHYRVELPKLIERIDNAEPDGMDAAVDAAKLLESQKDALHELIAYRGLADDAHVEVAKRLMADVAKGYNGTVARTDVACKVAPMLGLCGTLIPLGPGIVALGTGDTATLSDALLMAFDTTVAGLIVAAVCYVVSRIRRSWYEDYLVSIEGAMNTILERSAALRAAGAIPTDEVR